MLSSNPKSPEIANAEQIRRREFIPRFLGLVGLTAVAPAAFAADQKPVATNSSTTSTPKGKPENKNPEQKPGKEIEEEISELNRLSAMGVTAGFTATVLQSIVKNHGHLTFKHAGVVGGLELARLVALAGGNESDSIALKHEAAELLANSIPGLILVSAADFASSAVAFEPKNIYKNFGKAKIEIDWEILVKDRPALTGDRLPEWRLHQEKAASALSERVSQIIAVTSIAAPTTTTLTAAALFKDELAAVVHLCIELKLSEQIVKCIAANQNPKERFDELRHNAANEASELINGPWGYNQLGIALACNAQGYCGIGTPPNFWFMARHMQRDPLGFAKAQAYGATISELHGLVLTSHWVARATGKGFLDTLHSIIRNQNQAMKKVFQSLTDSDLRATTLGDGSKLAERLIPLLHNNEEILLDFRITAFQDAIESMRHSCVQFTFGEWLERKIEASDRILRRFPTVQARIGEIPDLTAAELDNFEVLQKGPFYASFQEALQNNNFPKVRRQLQKMTDWGEFRFAQRIAAALHAIALCDSDAEENIVGRLGLTADPQFNQSTLPSIEKTSEVEAELLFYSRALKQGNSFNSAKEKVNHAEQLLKEGVDPKRVIRELRFLNRSTFEKACKILIGIFQPLENIRSELGAGDTEKPIQGPAKVPQTSEKLGALSIARQVLQWLESSWTDNRNLSEGARAVAEVIATQLPAAPAISLTFSESMKWFVGAEANTRLTVEQLDQMLNLLPSIGYLVASMADNAPGYIILENVLVDLFEQTFGKDIHQKVPELKTELGSVAIIVASQSGMVFPFSSAPNLLQNHIEIVHTEDPKYPQGLAIERTALRTSDTTNSHYFHLSAMGTIGIAMLRLQSLKNNVIATLESQNNPQK